MRNGVAALGLLVTLAACSSSTSPAGTGSASSSGRNSHTAAGSASSSASSGSESSGANRGNDEAGKSADQIFNDSLAAMRHVEHVQMNGTQTDDTGTYSVSAAVTQTAARVDLRQGSADLVIVVVGGKAYASQNDRSYVELSPIEELRAQASTLSKTLDCAAVERGTLTKGEISTVNGVRAIAINDDGRAPGDAPNVTYVALDSLRVLRSTTTGRATAGGTDACGHSPNDSLSAARFDYDYQASVPAVTPPPVSPSGSPSGGQFV